MGVNKAERIIDQDLSWELNFGILIHLTELIDNLHLIWNIVRVESLIVHLTVTWPNGLINVTKCLIW